ncbi:stage IV sporulation protein B [Bhargavaea ginsengi]|uniref:Stage IV sporulation protein B n=1 Tax=Bhargavaea ginsengi TaxID=426757 RepID=A0A1H6X2Q3_9BACL|nr:SpoIVB peptidase S55 domain-containing protein [Bhargavaea ginsengi]SEJ19310.1 stage IV sporulation protein B [Bhargavaea ginsengi]
MRWISRKLMLFALLAVLFLTGATGAAADGPKTLIPMGHSIGIHLELGMLVVTDDVLVADGQWLRAGDIVKALDGKEVTTPQDISDAAEASGGGKAVLDIEREGREMEVGATKKELLNLPSFIRERTEGIGTLTYVDPKTGEYGALGHQIIDRTLDGAPPFSGGSIFLADVEQIKKSEPGKPGYKISSVESGQQLLGDIRENEIYGIFGKWTSTLTGAFPKPVEIMRPQEIREGEASIYTTIKGTEINKYSINITASADDVFRFTVTDRALIEKTGGILQGMSGSPIIQDGKFAGVVTHMFVEEPLKGAALPIGEMTKRKP